MRHFYGKLCFMVALALSVLGVNAQSPDHVSIEVAVVKQHPAAVLHNNFSFVKNRFELEDQPLLKMIAFAYGLNSRQIMSAPGWVVEDHWDMRGTTNLTTDATVPQEQQIVRELLAERFGLQFHTERRELPSYALRAFKDRPKLSLAADPSRQPFEWSEGHGNVKTENYKSSSMADFLLIKQLFMDRPLVDQTALAGRYDFKLTYSYGNAPSVDADAPPMATAMKEQLGLVFEAVAASVDVMVIEHISKPTPN